MNEIPTMHEEPDEADERYRRLSDRDAGGPSEPVRRAVLQHAAELAAQVRAEQKPAALERAVARKNRWRVPAYSGLAAAAVFAGLLTLPHFLLPTREPVVRTAAAPSPASPAAARETAAPRAAEQNGIARPRNSSSPTDARLQQGGGAPLAAAATAPALSLPRAESWTDRAAALRQAANSGNLPALRRIIAEKPDIDARDAGGRTALMLAVLRDQREAVDLLLAAGADPNAADASGTKPLQAALAGAHAAIAVALEQSGGR
jgi:ankyrin repeat protein